MFALALPSKKSVLIPNSIDSKVSASYALNTMGSTKTESNLKSFKSSS